MRSKSTIRGLTLISLVFAMTSSLGGCTGRDGSPVFGAVFGLESADTKPYQQGVIPEPEVGPGDDLIGAAANSPGQCIYRRAGSSRRLMAACPDGFQL